MIHFQKNLIIFFLFMFGIKNPNNSSMEGSFLFVCGYGPSTAAIKVDDSMSYEGLLQKICTKFNGVTNGNFSLMYSIPGYTNCILGSSEDLGNLYALLSVGNCRRAHVEIRDCSSITQVSSVSESDSEVDDYDLLPSFYAQPEKALLSDSWKDAIRKVGQRFEGSVREFRTSLVKFQLNEAFHSGI